ncbi:energy-coupling factor transporter ATPase [Mycoplasma zalophi]|uniref:Energy-coupling factor transporter ATPase n=1 Tax=Mycoplasma zalophi TaxID=191287 RepID=A0ABS6DPY6_9MOLU|nr:energy-coupling factor transporter ATPase [Mycoplasma zalophi]MBU4690809.1 energy-coupling factor transporter ATPase [Mycoplasma zalophi]MBU4692377.1 energy-coupling factor transporter ATPase [Mycoplasma zalophi]
MIKIKDLYYKYPESQSFALQGVNLEIQTGHYVAILGHNGSGKSTLSKLISAIYKATEGEIWIDDIIYSKENLKKIRQKIGIIFQNPDNQFVGATVEDDIAFGLENKHVPREQMKELIHKYAKLVSMDDSLDREPSNLSGGQKQRVAIASTLALDPDIIIFDEVTSMLDPKGKEDILEIIHNLHRNTNKILISITHDMDEAVLADELLVFSGGKLVASGSPKEILKNKEIVELAKIDSPFIYKLSEMIDGIEPTYDEKVLIEEICK